MGFSEKLRSIRREKNLSQEQLAELLNVSRQAVSKWEQDNGFPETEKLIQLAQKLDISLDELLLDRQPKSDTTNITQTPVAFGERKIFVRSADIDSVLGGGTLAAFYKFTISQNLFPSKDEPVCSISGVDKSGFWGDNNIHLGWYKTTEDARKEIDEIYKAMQKGETAYELKYNAKIVENKFFGVKLAD